MTTIKKARLSVSTWSLHRTLGRPLIYGPENEPVDLIADDRALPLQDLPARLAEFGIHTLEICHFHLPTQDADYLALLRSALEEHGIELFSLLIDGGDISNPQTAERDLGWTETWLDVAAQLGARNARVSAGKMAATDENLARSRAGFQRLVSYAEGSGVRIMTENWHELLSDAASVHTLLEPLGETVGLCADFGNWIGADKYDQLTAILPLAESCHAKCSFSTQTEFDRDDYVRCLELAQAAGFSGPYTLIYDGPGEDEWLGLSLEREVVGPYLSS